MNNIQLEEKIARYHADHTHAEMQAEIYAAANILGGHERGRAILRHLNELNARLAGGDSRTIRCATTIFLAATNGFTGTVKSEMETILPAITKGPWEEAPCFMLQSVAGHYVAAFDASEKPAETRANLKAAAALPAVLKALESAYERAVKRLEYSLDGLQECKENMALGSGGRTDTWDMFVARDTAILNEYRDALLSAGYTIEN